MDLYFSGQDLNIMCTEKIQNLDYLGRSIVAAVSSVALVILLRIYAVVDYLLDVRRATNGANIKTYIKKTWHNPNSSFLYFKNRMSRLD